MSKRAILITAYGTTHQSGVVYTYYENKVREKFSDFDISTCYTSTKVLEKVNADRKEKIPHFEEALTKLLQEGYEEIYINSLHIVPGIVYMKLVEFMKKVQNPNNAFLKITVPLLISKESIIQTVKGLQKHYDENAFNIVALHGTKEPHPSYIKFTEICENSLKNTKTAAVEGHPENSVAIKAACESSFDHVNIIPAMFVAGAHVYDDIMGEEDSWASELLEAGKSIGCPTKDYEGNVFYEGLGFNDDICEIFMNNLETLISRTQNEIKFNK